MYSHVTAASGMKDIFKNINIISTSIITKIFYQFFCSWIEFWSRKQRQYTCRAPTWAQNAFTTPIRLPPSISLIQSKQCSSYDIVDASNDFRDVSCSNRPDSLIEVMATLLKNEIYQFY